MLGEQDLNPFGFHAIDPGAEASLDDVAVGRAPRRASSSSASGAAAPTGSARPITQVILRMLGDGLDVAEAVTAPRVHFEAGVVHAEPGIDEAALDRLAARGLRDRPLA